MRLNNISFPYPVLGVNDDIQPKLKEDAVKVSLNRDRVDVYELNVSLSFDNPCISDLIEKGYAMYVCEIDCQKTNMRKSVQCSDSKFSFEINRKSVSGIVEVNCFVTVMKDIHNYVNPGFHEDYAGAVFHLTEGDILVGFPQCTFVADPKFDKLKSATSFMQIRHDRESEYTSFDFTDTTIDIKLPTELFNIYNSGVGTTFADVIHSSFAHGALLSALHVINQHPNALWAQAIVKLIQSTGEISKLCQLESDGEIVISDTLQVANLLLRDPYQRMLRKLNEINPSSSIFDND